MRKATVLLMPLVVALAACGGDGAKTKAGGKEVKAPAVCAFTGEKPKNDAVAKRAPLAVKVENSAPSRPQSGLDTADVVFEELAEGGITRFIAIYQCRDAEKIGPVRSARMVDPDLLQGFGKVLFASSGANKDVTSKVKGSSHLIDVTYPTRPKAYERVKDKKAPHNLFTSSEALRKEASGDDLPARSGLTFTKSLPALASPSPKVTPQSVPAKGADIDFAPGSLVKYAWDESARAYLRSHGDQAHKAADGKQIRATNVVVLKVKVRAGALKDVLGNPSPEMVVVGDGEAWVLRGGVATKGRWVRKSLGEPARLLTAGNEAIPLLAGNTWIEVIPQERTVTIQ